MMNQRKKQGEYKFRNRRKRQKQNSFWSSLIAVAANFIAYDLRKENGVIKSLYHKISKSIDEKKQKKIIEPEYHILDEKIENQEKKEIKTD